MSVLRSDEEDEKCQRCIVGLSRIAPFERHRACLYRSIKDNLPVSHSFSISRLSASDTSDVRSGIQRDGYVKRGVGDWISLCSASHSWTTASHVFRQWRVVGVMKSGKRADIGDVWCKSSQCA